MASFYKEGSRVQFEGYKGIVTKITETYKKNVLVVKITEFPRHKKNSSNTTLGLFEYPTGVLEFMSFIE